jgi:hypothetical protein
LAAETVTLHRYPRTRHLAGSFLAAGDDEGDLLPFERFTNQHIVVSEKIDGANTAVSFTSTGRMLLQSRSRFLEPQHVLSGPYAGLHQWAERFEDVLYRVLGTRYVMYGEWVKKKQSVFYDALPQAFIELDVLDTQTGHFLSTPMRRSLLRELPLVSAPVLADGVLRSFNQLLLLIGPSRFKTPDWKNELRVAIAEAHVLNSERLIHETDPSDDMEGLVLKVESGPLVIERAKYVRHGARRDFLHASLSTLRERQVENRVV